MNSTVPMATGPAQQFGPQYNSLYTSPYGPPGASQKVSSPSSSSAAVLSPLPMGHGPGPAMGPAPALAAHTSSGQPGVGLQVQGDGVPMMGGPGGAMMTDQGQIVTGPGPGPMKRGHMMMKGNMYGGGGGGGGLHIQRAVPYPNPQQYMLSKRAQFPNGQVRK